MKRIASALPLVAALALFTVSPLRAEDCASSGSLPSDNLAPSVLNPCFEGVAFGETRAATIEHCSARVRADYGVLMMAEKSATEKDALKKRMETDVADVGRNVTDFTGAPSGFDASPLAVDYAKNADEGLFEVTKNADRIYFFYSRDQLWKIVWVQEAKEPLDEVLKRVEVAYGKGARSKDDEKVATWASKALRVELVDERATFKAYVLRWIANDVEPKVVGYRKEKGAIAAPPKASTLGEDDVLNQALEKPEAVDNVVDDILGGKQKPVPDVAGEAKAKKDEKDKAKGIIRKPPKKLKKAPGPQPKTL